MLKRSDLVKAAAAFLAAVALLWAASPMVVLLAEPLLAPGQQASVSTSVSITPANNKVVPAGVSFSVNGPVSMAYLTASLALVATGGLILLAYVSNPAGFLTLSAIPGSGLTFVNVAIWVPIMLLAVAF